MMKLSTHELVIIERLLQNRINADYDQKIEEILHKVSTEINQRNQKFLRIEEWGM